MDPLMWVRNWEHAELPHPPPVNHRTFVLQVPGLQKLRLVKCLHLTSTHPLLHFKSSLDYF